MNSEIIDGWVNVPVGEPDPTAAYLFPGLIERWKAIATPAELVAQMDEAGVDRAVLVSGWGFEDSLTWATDALERYPDRFIGSHIVDPREGMKAVRTVSEVVEKRGFRMVRMLGFVTQLPYDDAAYYPIYAKCAELGAAVAVNVGIPGPQVPGKCQDPLALDKVCHFFPELSVIMAHGGEPWQEMCVKLMLKWPKLFYMTSAFAPKYIPRQILDYMNSRGADKIIWASDHPIITFDRCLDEIGGLEFRDAETRRRFLGGNAKRVLLGEDTAAASAKAFE